MSNDENRGNGAVVPYREPQSTDVVRAFIPADFPSTYRYAELICASGMAPKGMTRPETVATAIFMGAEVGMTPMAALRSIAVINGRPSIWGDGALGVIRAKGLLDDIEEWTEGGAYPEDGFTAYCRVKRKGVERDVTRSFSIAQAKRANLFGKEGPWQQYPERMMQMRARAFALRDLFTDVLGGFYIAEEMDDDEPIDITPRDPAGPPSPDDDGDGGGSESEPVKRRRGRPRKNRHQEDSARNPEPVTIEGEKVDAKPAEQKEAEKPKEESKPAADQKPKEEPERKPEPKEDPKPQQQAAPAAERKWGQEVAAIVPNLGAVGDALRTYLRDAHQAMDKAKTMDELKPVYQGFFQKWRPAEDSEMKKAEDSAFYALRDHHKKRVEKLLEQAKADAEKAATPPSPDDSGPPSPDDDVHDGEPFDYDGWKAHLDEQLGEARTPDDVNRIFAEMTEIPRREKVITEEQFDGELKQIAMKHLERVSF